MKKSTLASFIPGYLKARGFTLIEILIVMLIMSIVSGIAILTVSANHQKEIENIANQLSQTITLASTEAMLRPGTIGLALTENSYGFYLYQPKKTKEENPWETLSSKVFEKHNLPNNVYLALFIHNKKIALNGKPKIIISESGDFTPFILKLSRGKKPLYQIKGEVTGEVHVEPIKEV